MESLVIGAVASLAAGLATAVGALPILLPINQTQRVQGIMLGFGGGVMLAATSFSLIMPGNRSSNFARLLSNECHFNYRPWHFVRRSISANSASVYATRTLFQKGRKSSQQQLKKNLAISCRNYHSQLS